MNGRTLFGEGAYYESLEGVLEEGGSVKKTKLSDSFNWKSFRDQYGPDAVPLFVVSSSGKVNVVEDGETLSPSSGDRIIALVKTGGVPGVGESGT